MGIGQQSRAEFHSGPCRGRRLRVQPLCGELREHCGSIADNALGVGPEGQQTGVAQPADHLRRPARVEHLRRQSQRQLSRLGPGGSSRRTVLRRSSVHHRENFRQPPDARPLRQSLIEHGEVDLHHVTIHPTSQEIPKGMALFARGHRNAHPPSRLQSSLLKAVTNSVPRGTQRRVGDPLRQRAHPRAWRARPSHRYSYWAMPR